MCYDYELIIKSTCDALTQRRGSGGRELAAWLHVVYIEIIITSQEFERLRYIESPNAESGSLYCRPDDCTCIVRDP